LLYFQFADLASIAIIHMLNTIIIVVIVITMKNEVIELLITNTAMELILIKIFNEIQINQIYYFQKAY